ncbi:MAG: hypothetical protein WCJ19_02690 [bacterium]
MKPIERTSISEQLPINVLENNFRQKAIQLLETGSYYETKKKRDGGTGYKTVGCLLSDQLYILLILERFSSYA